MNANFLWDAHVLLLLYIVIIIIIVIMWKIIEISVDYLQL